MTYHLARTEAPHERRSDWRNLTYLWPYLWEFRGRVLLVIVCLVAAKLATVGVPVLLKYLIDRLAPDQLHLGLPVLLLLGYGMLRLATALFNELRDVLFARVRFRAVQRLSLKVLQHLHELSLRFHLARHTGSIMRDLERGTQSLSSLSNYFVFTIIPTVFELLLVTAILLAGYALPFAMITLLTVALYITFTVTVTNWRMHYRHLSNQLDSEANAKAVDSLLNYETVKYFNNEVLELDQYRSVMERWEQASFKSTATMSLLNFGQAVIIAVGVTGIMFYAAAGVVHGELTIGDLVLINAMMLQLFIPLNMLGIIYRQITYSLADMDLLVKLLERKPEVVDSAGAQALQVSAGHVRFEEVSFGYQPQRPILQHVNLEIMPGEKVAVVGPSGAGKSTLSRLLFRFYDVTAGSIRIDGMDIRECTQQSLRRAIAIVPQDTVLFNNTLWFNLQYANPQATAQQIKQAVHHANLDAFIAQLPDGYRTVVGERGLKLSGGEKQRVAIARAFLKQPRIMVFDEATSSLDSQSEQSILAAMKTIAQGVTTLVIAHRLSTIVDADRIYVLEKGCIVESGSHAQLLSAQGLYARLWQIQQRENEKTVVQAEGAAADSSLSTGERI